MQRQFFALMIQYRFSINELAARLQFSTLSLDLDGKHYEVKEGCEGELIRTLLKTTAVLIQETNCTHKRLRNYTIANAEWCNALNVAPARNYHLTEATEATNFALHNIIFVKISYTSVSPNKDTISFKTKTEISAI